MFFDFELPSERIAARPPLRREVCRFLVVGEDGKRLESKQFSAVLDELNQGDLLVLNNSKVLPTRFFSKLESGGKLEVLLLRNLSKTNPQEETWSALAKPLKKLKPGTTFQLSSSLEAVVLKKSDDGRKVELKISSESKKISELIDKEGSMPIPPYIRSGVSQMNKISKIIKLFMETVPGSVAAPTAGLHFTTELIEKIKAKGVRVEFITLHVGSGSFRLIDGEIENHQMDREYFTVPNQSGGVD